VGSGVVRIDLLCFLAGYCTLNQALSVLSLSLNKHLCVCVSTDDYPQQTPSVTDGRTVSVCLSVCLCVCLSVCVPVCVSVYTCVYVSTDNYPQQTPTGTDGWSHSQSVSYVQRVTHSAAAARPAHSARYIHSYLCTSQQGTLITYTSMLSMYVSQCLRDCPVVCSRPSGLQWRRLKVVSW